MRLFRRDRKAKEPATDEAAGASAATEGTDRDAVLIGGVEPPTVDLGAPGAQLGGAESDLPDTGLAEAEGVSAPGEDPSRVALHESDAPSEAPGDDRTAQELGSPGHGEEAWNAADAYTTAGHGAAEREPIAAAPEATSTQQPSPAAGAAQPSADVVASNGSGAAGHIAPRSPYAEAAWWQRPEAAVGAAFVGGLLLAAVLKRRHS
ncbi:MAG: hypothetical protein ACYDA6_04985 [Solirubrobacteraceae bacterium]